VFFKRDEEQQVSDNDKTPTVEEFNELKKRADEAEAKAAEATQKLQDAETKLEEGGEVSKRLQDLEKRLEERDTEVKDLREAEEMRQAIAKAEELETLFGPAAESAGIISKIDNTLNEDERKKWREKVDGALELIKQSQHFTELGVSGERGESGDAYQRLEQAAVKKFSDVSKAEAVSKFLTTDEGKKLYKAYREEEDK
jgi:hypothetical protein